MATDLGGDGSTARSQRSGWDSTGLPPSAWALGELWGEHGPKECTEVTHSVERDDQGLTSGAGRGRGRSSTATVVCSAPGGAHGQGAGAEGMLGGHSGFMETEVGCPGGTGRWVVWARDRSFENVTGTPLPGRELQALHTPSPAHRHGLPESRKTQARLASGNCPKGLRQLKKYLFKRIY